MGQYTGLGKLIKDEAPWLELAVKDAFDTSPFRKIDNMIMSKYHISSTNKVFSFSR